MGDQTGKTLELRSLSSKKDTKRSLKKIKKKNRRQKKAAAYVKSENAGAHAKNENAAAEAKSENIEAEAEEVDGTFAGTMVNDGVETTGEAGGRHPGMHTVNEEAGRIHTEHVEHDMNDDTGERTKTMHDTTNANGEQIEIVIENENAEAEPQKPR